MNTDYILNGGCEIRRSSKNIINNLRFSLILSNFAYERGKRSFVSLSSGRQTEYGRSSCRLVHEQLMLAKVKG